MINDMIPDNERKIIESYLRGNNSVPTEQMIRKVYYALMSMKHNCGISIEQAFIGADSQMKVNHET